MANARSLVFKIQGDYDNSSMKSLQNDLNKIAKIDAFEKLRASFAKTNESFNEAKKQARDLRKELRAGGGDEVAKQYAAAQKQVAALGKSLEKQRANLRGSSDDLRQMGLDTTDLSGNYKKLSSAVEKQSKAIAGAMKLGITTTKQKNDKVRELIKAYRDLESSGVASVQDLAKAKEVLSKKIADIRGETERQAKAEKKAAAAAKQRAIGARKFAREQEKAAKNALKNEKKYREYVKKTTEALKAKREAARKSNKETSDVGGVAAGVGGVAGVQQAGQAALLGIQKYAEFDDALRETKAAAALTAEEFEGLKNKALELGRSPGLTATNIAQGMAESARAGQNYNEILASVAANAQLAQGSELDFAESVEFSTDILAMFGRGADETQNLVDTLILGANSASVKVGQLAEAYSYAGAVANSFGKETNAVAAQFLVLANSSLKAERGGTSLRAIWDVLLTKSSQFKKTFDIDVTEVINGEEKVRDLADIIDDLGKVGMTATQRTDFFGKIAGPGIAVMLEKGGDAIRKYKADLDNAGGAGERVSKILQEGIGGEGVRKVTSSFEILVLQITDSLEPALKSAGSTVGDFLLLLSDLPKPVLATVTALAGLSVAAIGLVAAYAGWLVIAPTIAASFTAITAGAAAMASALAPVVVALGSAAAVYKAADAYIEMRDAQDMAAKSAENAAAQWAKVRLRLQKASEETGIHITNVKQLRKLYKEGKIDYDELTDTYSKGSGVMRKDAEKIVKAEEKKQEAFKFTSKTAQKSAEKQKKSAEEQKEYLAELKKEYESLANEIESVDKQLIKLSDEGFATQLKLENAGRSPIEAWKAQKRDVEDLGRVMAEAKDDAERLASEGDIDGANKSYARAVELGKQMRDGIKALAVEVKAEFTPAMQSSLDAAKDAAQDFGKKYTKAMQDAKQAGDDLKSTTEDLAAAEKGLADAQRDARRAGMSDAQAYQDVQSEQRILEDQGSAALKAGDYDLAIAKAQEARQVASELNQEIKNGEQIVVSAEQAKRNASAAEISARQLEVAALKAKQAAEQQAEAEAIARAEKLKAAKEAEAAKVAELEAKKAEVVKTEAEAAKEAAKLEAQARKEITDILQAQKEVLTKLADEKNKEADWTLGDAYTQAGEDAKTLFEVNKSIQDQLKNIPADAVIDWSSMWTQIEAAGVSSAEKTGSKWDEATRDRYMTTYVKEVQQRFAGGVVQKYRDGGIPFRPAAAGALSPGSILGGFGGEDRIPLMARGGEGILEPYTVRDISRATFHDLNNRRYERVIPQLMKKIGMKTVSPKYIRQPLQPAAISGERAGRGSAGTRTVRFVFEEKKSGLSAAGSFDSPVDLNAYQKMMAHQKLVSSR